MNQLIPFDTDRDAAEKIVYVFNNRKRAGRLYYRTKIFKSGPESPLFITTLEYQPSSSSYEVLVGQYEPPVTVEGVLEDIRRAKVKAETDAFEPKNPAAIALGRLGGKVGGPARAAALPADRRSEIASQAAQARWDKPATDGDSSAAPAPKKRGRPKGWKPKPKVQAEQLQAAPALDMDAVYNKAQPEELNAEQYSFSALQKKFDSLTEEHKNVTDEITALAMRQSEIEEKLKSINKICQLANEVMNED